MGQDFRNVTVADLEDFSARVSRHFVADYENHDPDYVALRQVAKMGEEFGEACEAVLACFGHQRTDKLGRDMDARRAAAEDELADVILSALGLASRMGLSVSDGMSRAVSKVAERAGISPVAPRP